MAGKASAPQKPLDWERLRPLRRRTWFARPPEQVAQELLGMLLIRADSNSICAGRIVETEAYLAANDPACHAARGPTRKNASMFGPAGHAYVYAIHSRWCMNVVTEREGSGSAVLIRAIEPLAGIERMTARRGMSDPMLLTRGPARLCEALGIDRAFDGWDLTRGETLWLARDPGRAKQPAAVLRSTRIGVTSAHDLLLRYFYDANHFVSGHRRGLPVSTPAKEA